MEVWHAGQRADTGSYRRTSPTDPAERLRVAHLKLSELWHLIAVHAERRELTIARFGFVRPLQWCSSVSPGYAEYMLRVGFTCLGCA